MKYIINHHAPARAAAAFQRPLKTTPATKRFPQPPPPITNLRKRSFARIRDAASNDKPVAVVPEQEHQTCGQRCVVIRLTEDVDTHRRELNTRPLIGETTVREANRTLGGRQETSSTALVSPSAILTTLAEPGWARIEGAKQASAMSVTDRRGIVAGRVARNREGFRGRWCRASFRCVAWDSACRGRRGGRWSLGTIPCYAAFSSRIFPQPLQAPRASGGLHAVPPRTGA